MPISEAVYCILNKDIKPVDAVKMLMQRTIKVEHL